MRERKERRQRAINRHGLLAIEVEISSVMHHSRLPCIIPVPVFVTKTELSNSISHVLDSSLDVLVVSGPLMVECIDAP